MVCNGDIQLFDFEIRMCLFINNEEPKRQVRSSLLKLAGLLLTERGSWA